MAKLYDLISTTFRRACVLLFSEYICSYGLEAKNVSVNCIGRIDVSKSK